MAVRFELPFLIICVFCLYSQAFLPSIFEVISFYQSANFRLFSVHVNSRTFLVSVNSLLMAFVSCLPFLHAAYFEERDFRDEQGNPLCSL